MSGIAENTAENGWGLEFAGNCFSDAVTEVINTAANLELHEINADSICHGKYTGIVSGVMLLTGERNAVLSLTISQYEAAALVSYMTGNLPEELGKEEICDGIAELVNMTAGRAKVKLKGTEYHFNITPPFSILGRDYSTVYKSGIPRIHKKFAAGDMVISLEVAYV